MSCDLAEKDGERMREGYLSGGPEELKAVSHSIYGASTEEPAPAESVVKVQDELAWKVEAQKDGAAFRAVCTILKGQLPQIDVLGPWRDLDDFAELDALAMWDAFEQGGMSAVNKVKQEFFEQTQ